MTCAGLTDNRKCETIFCIFCGILLTRLTMYRHNDNWENDKSKCVLFLDSHPLFQNLSGSEATDYFQYYRTLRLLRKYKESACAKFGIEMWQKAVSRKNDLFVNSSFNYFEGLSTDYPNPDKFDCSLP